MKKIFSALILGALLAGIVVPALAQNIPEKCDITLSAEKDATDCKITNPCDLTSDPNCSFCCMLNSVYKVTQWLFYIVSLIVVLMIIYGGFVYITAAGSPEKAGKGKQVLTFALIGLVIALVAKLVPSIVKFFVGVS